MDYQELTTQLKETLGLRWDPVALRLLRPGEEVPPGVIEPAIPLRHCQSIIAARRGNCLYMPPAAHACPDGSGILGLTQMSEKLRSGALYLLFRKMPNIETAQQMISTRAEFTCGSYRATVLAPLAEATFEPDVVIFTLWPEQTMWLCAAQTYATGRRQNFQVSGFNSTCSDLVVKPVETGDMNISFGCYGARASSEIDDFEMYLSIPFALLEDIVPALRRLAQKSIPESRRKIYLPPVLNRVGARRSAAESTELFISQELCQGDGLCVAFCPVSALEMTEVDGQKVARAVHPELCTRCYTCVGQCPAQAIQLT